MKRLGMIVILMVLSLQTAFASEELDKDINAIEAMAGCYAVDFSFFETRAIAPDHELKKPYLTGAYEYVVLEQSYNKEDHTIILQHILDFGGRTQKHWRQDWVYGETDRLDYKGVSTQEGAIVHAWSKSLNHEQIWTQKTYGVGDEPRYACSADWSHSKYASDWKCKAWTPLPRRDYSQGFYYNALDRGNHVLVDKRGWRHVQENTKIAFNGELETPIAEEIGVNSYIKVDDSHCMTAIEYWEKTKENWSDIRGVWNSVFADLDTGESYSMIDTMVIERSSPYDDEVKERDTHLYELLMEDSELSERSNVKASATEHIDDFRI